MEEIKYTQKRSAGVVWADVEANCFSNNTDILTENNGWKDLFSINVGDSVATYNIEERRLEYQLVNSVIKKNYTGKMIDFGLGLLATPDHRMVVLSETGSKENRKRRTSNMKIDIIPANKLYRGLRLIPFVEDSIYPKIYNSPFEGISGEDWCDFMGWYLSEGCVAGVNGNPKIGKYQVYISQNQGEKKERIKELLIRMNLPIHERKGDLWFTDKRIHQHLFPLGTKYDKYIPRYIFNYPKEYLQKMWQSLLDGDGDGKKRYITTSERLADDIQEMLLRIGYRTSLRKWNVKGNTRGFGKSGNTRDQYCVSSLDKRYNYINNKIKEIDYNGQVGCVSVPNGTIIVRDKKEKYPIITGNCIDHGTRGRLKHSDIEKMVALYDPEDKQARIHGLFQHLTGLVYKKFNIKIHVIKPFVIKKRDYITMQALDPHPRNEDAVMWLSKDNKGNYIVTDELYGKYTTSELAKRVKEIDRDYRIVKRIADPCAWVQDKHNEEEERCLASDLYNLGLEYEPASKTRKKANRRIADALDYEMVGDEMLVAPELYIFDTCVRTIFEISHLIWSDWRGKSSELKNPLEKPVDKDDHEIENLGRLLLQDIEWFPMPSPVIRNNRSISVKQSLDPFA